MADEKLEKAAEEEDQTDLWDPIPPDIPTTISPKRNMKEMEQVIKRKKLSDVLGKKRKRTE